jgi:hypothetical protein
MDAFSRSFRNTVSLLISPLLAAIVLAPGDSLAVCHPEYCTRCAWHRTWHGPNVLATPLSGYYIPRRPAMCDCYGCADGCGDAVGESYALWPTDYDCEPGADCSADCCSAALALEPSGMERLGQIPNDLELSAGVPDANSNRPSR